MRIICTLGLVLFGYLNLGSQELLQLKLESPGSAWKSLKAVANAPKSDMIRSGIDLIGVGSPNIKAVCFRGKPISQCNSFLITELGGYYKLNRNDRAPKGSQYLIAWELGWMKNLNEDYALGGTLLIEGNEHTKGIGLKPRLRRWLSPELSVDVSLGILKSQESGSGLTGDVSLNWRDWFFLTSKIENVNRTAWYGGVKFGSYAGLITTAVAVPVLIFAGLLSASFQ